MADIQWREPEVFAAGDTLKFQRYLPAYLPSGGWSLHYVLTALLPQAGKLAAECTSTASGDDHTIAADGFAAELDAGDYILTGTAINGAKKHQIYYGELALLADLEAGTSTAAVTTHAQRMIVLLESQIETLSQHALQETDVQKTRFVWMKRDELRTMLKEYQEKRMNEVNLENIRNGKGGRDQIMPVFNIA